MKSRPTVVWIAGTNWDSVPGTDKRIVACLASRCNILWVDPPKRKNVSLIRQTMRPVITEEQVGVFRLVTPALPGVTRPGVRILTNLLLWLVVSRALKCAHVVPDAVVVAFPLAKFSDRLPGRRVLYATDDWLGGAELMGLSKRWIRRVLKHNLGVAHGVAAISEEVLTRLSGMASGGVVGRRCIILPNGCEPPVIPAGNERSPIALLVGQLNERLDTDVLDALCTAQVPILVLGDRTDRDPDFGKILDKFLGSKNIQWSGSVPADQLNKYLCVAAVGLTPYANTEFNRASFPLKTLEYVASGLSVVSTDLPASRWLASEHVVVSTSVEEFVRNTIHAINNRHDREPESARRKFAAAHSWDSRATELFDLLNLVTENEPDRNPDVGQLKSPTYH
jgi:teichuronic acid biosynthesis glycosyltransferase TuaH